LFRFTKKFVAYYNFEFSVRPPAPTILVLYSSRSSDRIALAEQGKKWEKEKDNLTLIKKRIKREFETKQ
jgi:hypothetical protein